MSKVIEVDNITKKYDLGTFGTGSLRSDVQKWWARVNKKEDPTLKIGLKDKYKDNEKEYWALKGIGFEVKQGEVLGIIGKNGAGKSTLLKILSRITLPTSGSIKVKGRIASLLEVGTGFHPELSGRDNIFLNGAILGMSKSEIKSKFDEIVEFSGVSKFIDTPVKRYSSGMYVRLAFGVAAHLEPEILIIDEVLAVGDAEFQQKCLGKMKDVASQGRTVLFVSHQMSAVKNLCTRGIMLEKGRVAFAGSSGDAVDAYILNNVKSAVYCDFVQIDDSYRRYSQYHLRIADFLSVEMEKKRVNNSYATSEEINFLFEIKGHKDIPNFRIAGGVFDMEETCIGVFFCEEVLSVRGGDTVKAKLSLKGHSLAKGKYYIDFSIGTGNMVKGFTDFDHISKSVFFEIAYTDETMSEMITNWDSNWGHINFQKTDLIQL